MSAGDGPLNLVRLLEAGQAEWCIDGRRGQGTLEALAGAVRGQPWILLVPGEAVPVRRVQVPAGSRRQRREAVPFAMEEILAAELETLHFAFGDDDAQRGILTAAIEREPLERWLAALHGVGLAPSVAAPAALLLPGAGWSLLLEGESADLRLGADGALGCEVAALEWLLPAALAATEPSPRHLRAHLCGGSGFDFAVDGLEVESIPCDDDRLGWLSRHGRLPPLNLLQGRFAPRRSELPSRRWLPAAALLLAWGLVALGTQALQWHRLAGESHVLEKQITDIFRHTFPGPHRIVNARVQMAQRLKALRAGAVGDGPDVVQMVGAVERALVATSGVAVQGLDYRGHRLTLTVGAADSATLDNLRRRIADGGALQAQLDEVNASGGRFSGRLLVEAGP